MPRVSQTPPPKAAARWALVLAAGEGSRLRHLTVDEQGRSVPKQFCRLNGGSSLLTETVRRAARVVPGERIVTVVAAQHERWWRRDLAAFPPANVVVQPENRGTAAGILLPLLAILERDPEAAVVILPSDHFVANERVLAQAIGSAFNNLHREPDAMLLLGMTAESADPELGWIVPAGDGVGGFSAVARFVEKPPPALAAELYESGALLNSFILVAGVRALVALFLTALPDLLARVGKARARAAAGLPNALADAYHHLPIKDFSRDLLQGNERRLRVLRVPACGWSDLGTPERLRGAVLSRRDVRGPQALSWPEALTRFLAGGPLPVASAA